MVLDKKWQVFFLVAVSVFMSTLDSSIVNVALPYIMGDLSEQMGRIQRVVTVYLLFVSAFLLTFGRISDILGRPKVYRLGFGIFTLGSFLCGISGSLEGLILSRVIQGLGASMLMACSPALITDVFEPENRGRALGLIGACVAGGLTIGPVLAGILLEYFSWPVIFYINIPVGLAALVYSRFVLGSEKPVTRETMDWVGSLLMIILVAALVIGLVGLPEWEGGLFQGMGCLITGLGAGAGFIINARKTSHPLIDPSLFKIRMFVFPLAAAMILFAALFILIFMMPFYLSLVCGFSPAMTGLAMIVPFLVLFVISPVAGTLADRLGSGRLCLAGMGILALALILTGTLSPSAGGYGICWRLALAGLGTALFISPNSTAVMGAVPIARRGIASGALATARNLGMVIGVALASGIFTHTFTGLTFGIGLDQYTPEMADSFMAGFRFTMVVGAGSACFGMGVSLARGRDEGRIGLDKSGQEIRTGNKERFDE